MGARMTAGSIFRALARSHRGARPKAAVQTCPMADPPVTQALRNCPRWDLAPFRVAKCTRVLCSLTAQSTAGATTRTANSVLRVSL